MENQSITQATPQPQHEAAKTKFCKHCGTKIPDDAIICTTCGRQVEVLQQNATAAQPNIIINNANTNTNTNNNNNAAVAPGRSRSKWVALALCFFLGWMGAHKFYEGKSGMGVVYLFTLGLFGIGVIIDFITLLFKTNPYYV